MCQTLPGAEIMMVNRYEIVSDPTRVYQVGKKKKIITQMQLNV